jgi:hypothetical protein
MLIAVDVDRAHRRLNFHLVPRLMDVHLASHEKADQHRAQHQHEETRP